jgi:hypothetical protein
MNTRLRFSCIFRVIRSTSAQGLRASHLAARREYVFYFSGQAVRPLDDLLGGCEDCRRFVYDFLRNGENALRGKEDCFCF